jgi:hypothetical protein
MPCRKPMPVRQPEPPAGLGVAGKRAWRAAIASLPPDARFTRKELEGVRLVAGQADTVARLEREIEEAAPKLPLSAVRALTAARVALARLLSEVRLEVNASEGLPVRSRRAQRAAQARWRARREQAEQRRTLAGG